MSRPFLRLTVLLLIGFALPPSSVPAAAQVGALRSTCTSSVYEGPEAEKPKKPRAPDEARRDSVQRQARAALREVIDRHAAASAIEAPQGLLLFRAPRDGAPIALTGYRTNLPDSVLARIEQDAAVALADWPREARPYVSMRVDSLRIPKPAVGDTVTQCTPELLHREQVTRALQDFFDANPRVNRRRTQQTVVQFLLTREGRVLAPYVHRSSGNQQLDDFALDLVPRLLFRVAEYNGVPVDVWSSIPITIRRPSERPNVPGLPERRVP